MSRWGVAARILPRALHVSRRAQMPLKLGPSALQADGFKGRSTRAQGHQDLRERGAVAGGVAIQKHEVGIHPGFDTALS